MRSIYKFECGCGRAGTLRGTFTAEAEDVAFSIGKRVWFSEPFGKHTEAWPDMAAEYFTIVSSDPAEVATFDRLKLRSGDCPLGILADQISDGAMELSDEDKANAPAYFRRVIKGTPEHAAAEAEWQKASEQ